MWYWYVPDVGRIDGISRRYDLEVHPDADAADWWSGLWKSAAKWLHATKLGKVRRAGSNPVQSVCVVRFVNAHATGRKG